MGILSEMFDEENKDDLPAYEGEFIAAGEYDSRPDEILEGYKVYQKKYVYRSLVWKMLIVLVALTSSVMMIMTSKGDEIMPVFCLMLCICIGIWFISQPITNKKKLKSGLEINAGTPYKAEFFTDKIIISDMSPIDENAENAETGEDTGTSSDKENETSDEEKRPPASVIHLDSPIVNIIDRSDMFILVVNKSYVFIIPKRGFSEEGTEKIKEKLSVIMGVRYKAV